MSLQKRELAQEIAQLQVELSIIIESIRLKNHECDDDIDRIASLKLKAVVLERDIDQLQKQFSTMKEYEC